LSLDNKAIEEIVEDSSLISDEELAKAIETSKQMGKDLQRVLLEKNLISEKDLSQLISNYYGVNYVDLNEITIPKDVLSNVPEELARSSRVVPYDKNEKTLFLAMTDPKDLSAIDTIRKETGLDVEPAYTSEESLNEGLNQYRKDIKEEFAQIIKETSDRQRWC
jgi:type IV pilus assembly protein PilB